MTHEHKITRRPDWLKKKLPTTLSFGMTKNLLDKNGLNTVCEEARCPNRWECFSNKTATFLIMGPYCTRNCKFCSVEHRPPLPLNDNEIHGILEFTKKMSLKYVVVTSVTRDDLKDGGASFFAKLINFFKKRDPEVKIEVLIPDFKGDLPSLKMVVSASPNVLNHNIETVPRLYKHVRPRADYKRSLNLLKKAKEMDPSLVTKSGIMVGLGESWDEIIETLTHIRETGCDIITIGQYLQPTKRHMPVARYYHPEEFVQLGKIAKDIGFRGVVSGVFVRSSYRAYEKYMEIII